LVCSEGSAHRLTAVTPAGGLDPVGEIDPASGRPAQGLLKGPPSGGKGLNTSLVEGLFIVGVVVGLFIVGVVVGLDTGGVVVGLDTGGVVVGLDTGGVVVGLGPDDPPERFVAESPFLTSFTPSLFNIVTGITVVTHFPLRQNPFWSHSHSSAQEDCLVVIGQ